MNIFRIKPSAPLTIRAPWGLMGERFAELVDLAVVKFSHLVDLRVRQGEQFSFGELAEEVARFYDVSEMGDPRNKALVMALIKAQEVCDEHAGPTLH